MSKNDFITPAEKRRETIIGLIRERSRITKKQLAERFGCSSKTIQRDITYLQDEGWPIEFDMDGFYLREASSAERKVTDNKITAVLALAGCTVDKNLSAFAPEVVKTIKQRYFGCDDLPDRCDGLERPTDTIGANLNDADLEVFGVVTRNILSEQNISILYQSMHDSSYRSREVFPVQLKEREGVWYLLAFDYGKEKPLVFKLKKIQEAKLSDQDRPAPDEEMINQMLDWGQFSIWDDPRSKQYDIKVKLYGYAAQYIQDTQIHPSQKIQVISDDETYLTLGCGDLVGVGIWLKKFAQDVEVISPQCLKNTLREQFELFLRRNQ